MAERLRAGTIGGLALALGALLAAPARGQVPVEIDVTYEDCRVVEGPLSGTHPRVASSRRL